MTSPDETQARSTRFSNPEPPVLFSRVQDSIRRSSAGVGRPLSDLNLSLRKPNLSSIFASTSLSSKRASTSSIGSTPISSPSPDSFFSSAAIAEAIERPNAYHNLVIRSFAPHVAILPSEDTEALLVQKGFLGGFLEIIRPFGDNVLGKVTIRDSTGSSRSWEDFAVRFTRLKDGLEEPRLPERKSTDGATQNVNDYVDRFFASSSARIRTGGDIPFIESAVESHLSYSELQGGLSPNLERTTVETAFNDASPYESDFHQLYLRRLLSGIPLSPHETFSHPVACIIVISSRNEDPIEELRQLYANTNTGDQRMPPWVNNDYLRYYVLLHDEEHDDIQRSTTLFDQMKRHFGLHCHLLRLRSTQAVTSDDDCVKMPMSEWLSASEELSEIQRRDNLDGVDDEISPCLFESDTVALRNLVREMVTQSIVPTMERLSATWNDQIASRRRGISGRFISLSKKWTPFGSGNRSSSAFGGSSASNSNYDSLQSFYRPDAPEALMRKLADYAFMLRDFKLAQSTYEILRNDYSNDKAWKYYAGANEMTAITALMNPQPLPTKPKTDTVDQMLESAVYSYTTRCRSPYLALRTLIIASELLLLRGSASADDAAKWAWRILELELVGPVGNALTCERIAACFARRKGTGSKQWGARRRKAALWNVFATESWLGLEKASQAEKCLAEVFKLYHVHAGELDSLAFTDIKALLTELRDAVLAAQGSTQILDVLETTVEPVKLTQDVMENKEDDAVSEKVDIRSHRKSVIGMSTEPVQLALSDTSRSSTPINTRSPNTGSP